jgi:hypothetical protein
MNQTSGLDFLDLHPFVRETVLDKVRGTIFGGTLSDVIGLYTGEFPSQKSQVKANKAPEFLSRDLSLALYPEGKFQLVEPATELMNDGHRSMCLLFTLELG